MGRVTADAARQWAVRGRADRGRRRSLSRKRIQRRRVLGGLISEYERAA